MIAAAPAEKSTAEILVDREERIIRRAQLNEFCVRRQQTSHLGETRGTPFFGRVGNRRVEAGAVERNLFWEKAGPRARSASREREVRAQGNFPMQTRERAHLGNDVARRQTVALRLLGIWR